MLDQLNHTLGQATGTSLGTVVHDRYLFRFAQVPHGNCRINRVEVARDVLGVAWPLEGRVKVEDALLHFEAVGISVECLVGIEVVVHLEVDSHVLADAV